MKIIYTQKINKQYCDEILSMGFDTILSYNIEIDMLDYIQSIGLKCISSIKVEHESIIAYYLYDEPDLNEISIEEQELKIQEYRLFTNKPLAIACIEKLQKYCSSKFDWYLLDIYYNTKTLSKMVNYLNVMFSSQFIQILYKDKKIIPIMGIFDDNDLYGYSTEIFPFAKYFRSMFPSSDHAIFIFDSAITFNGILSKDEYKKYAIELNSTNYKCWYRKILYNISYVFIIINNLLGKYKLVI